jgi:tRNA-dihydrouridine synthase A
MVDRSDRHFRWFLRRLTRRTLLYTPMVSTGAILHGPREELLGFDDCERPLALQLGGSDPRTLAECARIGADSGFDEIDLNVGCPSDSVQEGSFGACLMGQPERVAEMVAAMRAVVPLPVTVKHRIGIDDLDRYEDMARFVRIVAEAGCDRFVVHARKAWLHGVSPKRNRTVPPLRHEDVHRLKRENPGLAVEINGGIRSLAQVREHLRLVDGVMIGRAAFEDPWIFATADAEVHGDAPAATPTRREVVESMIPYVEAWAARGVPPARITRHLFGLFAGQRGSRAWKRALDAGTFGPSADPAALARALEVVPPEVLDARAEPVTASRSPGRESRE